MPMMIGHAPIARNDGRSIGINPNKLKMLVGSGADRSLIQLHEFLVFSGVVVRILFLKLFHFRLKFLELIHRSKLLVGEGKQQQA